MESEQPNAPEIPPTPDPPPPPRFPTIPARRAASGDKDDRGDLMTSLVRVSAIGTNFAFAVIGMGVVGYFIDKYAKTSPRWTLVLLGAGIVGGAYRFVHDAMALNKKRPRK